MKQDLKKLATGLADLAKKHDDPYIAEIADELSDYANRLPYAPQTTSDDQNDNGGIEVPKKPPPP